MNNLLNGMLAMFWYTSESLLNISQGTYTNIYNPAVQHEHVEIL